MVDVSEQLSDCLHEFGCAVGQVVHESSEESIDLNLLARRSAAG